MEDLGRRIRSARKGRGWTLEMLSSRSGLSPGFLSQVERDLTSLSIVSLSAICRGLELPIESLFSSNRPLADRPSVITLADQQLHLRIGGSPVSYQYLSGQLPDQAIQELLIAEFPPDCRQFDAIHLGSELGYVLHGRLTLHVEAEEYALSPGDSYRILASQSHGYETSPSAGAAVLMAVSQRFIDLPPSPPAATAPERSPAP